MHWRIGGSLALDTVACSARAVCFLTARHGTTIPSGSMVARRIDPTMFLAPARVGISRVESSQRANSDSRVKCKADSDSASKILIRRRNSESTLKKSGAR